MVSAICLPALAGSVVQFSPSNLLRGHRPAAVNVRCEATTPPTAHGHSAGCSATAAAAPTCNAAAPVMNGDGFQRRTEPGAAGMACAPDSGRGGVELIPALRFDSRPRRAL